MQNETIKGAFEDKMAKLKAKQAAGEVILPEDRIHVAVLGDSPNVVTGFGNVCREILSHLYATGFYDFEVVGINYDGSPHDLPFKIYPAINALVPDPAYRNPYGMQRFLDLIGEGRFDLVWVLQDTFIVCEEFCQRIVETNETLPVGQQFGFMLYFPIDATPKKNWIDKSALLADFPVVYTKYGYDEVMKLYAVDENSKLTPEEQTKNVMDGKDLAAKLSIVYHGSNMQHFFPITDAERVTDLRNKLWGDAHKNKFVFINVNRNQPRKDIFRTLEAFKILLDRRRAKGKDDVYLYLHCNIFDNNMNIIDMGKQLDLVEGDEYAYPDPKRFGPATGFPVSVVNDIYNGSDAVVSSTLGEGWGLSISEGLSTKKPVIAPDHTSITEILGKTEHGQGERGFLVKTKGSFVQPNDNARVRPITDAVDMADKMEWLVDHREMAQGVVDAGFEWISNLNWAGPEVGGKWVEIFEKAYIVALGRRGMELDKQLAKQIQAQKLGRNDECPVCKPEKYKNCRHFPK